jgi:hypothetical protein
VNEWFIMGFHCNVFKKAGNGAGMKKYRPYAMEFKQQIWESVENRLQSKMAITPNGERRG